jgi:uncharacterized protein YndB with AHSA1/START domain
MKRLQYSTTIEAPRQKVWDTMLQDETYRRRTKVFNPTGSWYEGDWNAGSTIRFLGTDKDGNVGGMVSRIKENRPYEFVSIEHLGLVSDGQDDTTSDAVKAWAGALENYTLTERNGATNVLVEIDLDQEHEKMFEETWPRALAALKELAEAKDPAVAPM